MKYAEINARFTEVVNGYIAMGYVVNTTTMSGHQGEIAKIDLTDGKDIIRVMLESCYNIGGSDLEGIKLFVGRCTDGAKPNSSRWGHTIWASHCEVILTEIFYEVGETRRGGGKSSTARRKKQKQQGRLELNAGLQKALPEKMQRWTSPAKPLKSQSASQKSTSEQAGSQRAG